MNAQNKTLRICIFIISIAIVSGCNTFRYEKDITNVKADVSSRLSAKSDIRIESVYDSEGDTDSFVAKILESDLTLGSAIQLTILNNPELQASFENLGIRKAELMEAAILANPNVHIDRAESHSGRFRPHLRRYSQYHWTISMDLIDLFSKPNLAQISKAQIEVAKLRLTNQVLEKISDVSDAVHDYLYEQKSLSILEEIFSGDQAKLELAIEQNSAGNISDLDLVRQQMEYQDAKLQLTSQQRQLLLAKENLNKLMGLWGHSTAWTINPEFPDLEDDSFTENTLISSVLENNLELAAANYELNIFKRQYGMSKMMIIPSIEFGASREKEDAHDPTNGRSLAFELPLFDHNQSEKNKLRAMIQKREKEIEAISIGLRSDLTLLYSLYTGLKKRLSYYESAILPIRKKYLILSEHHYNGMFIGPYELLDVKRSELLAKQDYYRTLRDCLNARSDLIHALAGGHIGSSNELESMSVARPTQKKGHSGH